MIPYRFQIPSAEIARRSAGAASRALPDAKFLAGGQTLIPTMKMRLASPANLIDISGIEGTRLHPRAEATPSSLAPARRITMSRCLPNSGAPFRRLPIWRTASAIPPSVIWARWAARSPTTIPQRTIPRPRWRWTPTIKTTKRTHRGRRFFRRHVRDRAGRRRDHHTKFRFPFPERAGYAKFPNPASRYAIAGVFVAKTKSGVRVAVTGAAPCVFRVPAMEAALSRNFVPQAHRGNCRRRRRHQFRYPRLGRISRPSRDRHGEARRQGGAAAELTGRMRENAACRRKTFSTRPRIGLPRAAKSRSGRS